MAHFIVTFRIADDSGYQVRYESFLEEIYKKASGGSPGTWEETTSFLSFESSGTADSMCNSLYMDSKFDASKDMMVVLELDSRTKAVKGPISYLATLNRTIGF